MRRIGLRVAIATLPAWFAACGDPAGQGPRVASEPGIEAPGQGAPALPVKGVKGKIKLPAESVTPTSTGLSDR